MGLRPTLRRQRGSAVVELALVLTPLLALLTATADLGRALYTYSTLTNAARGAARYLAVAAPQGSTVTVRDQARATALNLVLTGNPDGSGTPLVAGLVSDNVHICISDDPACNDTHRNVATGAGTVSLVSVRIEGYTYGSLFSFVLPASLSFSAIGVTMRH